MSSHKRQNRELQKEPTVCWRLLAKVGIRYFIHSNTYVDSFDTHIHARYLHIVSYLKLRLRIFRMQIRELFQVIVYRTLKVISLHLHQTLLT